MGISPCDSVVVLPERDYGATNSNPTDDSVG